MNYKLFLFITFFFLSCNKAHSGDKTITETFINNRFKAILEFRSGGGAAGYVTEDLYIYDNVNKYKVHILSGRGLRTLQISWEDDFSINIGYNWDIDIYFFKNRLYPSENYRVNLYPLFTINKYDNTIKNTKDTITYRTLKIAK